LFAINNIMKKIGIFTGKFKPPHKGHCQIINEALYENDEVRVYVSGKVEEGIDAKTAVSILKSLVGENEKVCYEETTESPVKEAYRYVNELGQQPDAADIEITVYSTPEDMARFDKLEKFSGNIRKIKRRETQRAKADDGSEIHARDMRACLQRDDFESFKKGLPAEADAESIWKMLKEAGYYTVPADSFRVRDKRQSHDSNPVPIQKLVQHPTFRDGFMNENHVLGFNDFISRNK